MVTKILMWLGFVKITPKQLFEAMEELYLKTIEHAQEKRQLSPENRCKSSFEIALFLHCATIPIFQRILSDDTWEELRYLIQDDIMLRGLDNVEKGTIKKIISERFDVHENGLYQGKGTNSYGENYYKLLYDMFYVHPMESIEEIKKLNKLDLDFHSRIRKQAEMTLFVEQMIPAFRKSAKQLARITRK